MDANRWQRARDVFLEICDAAPTERQALLMQRCGDDEALRSEVAELLASSEEEGGVLNAVPVGSAAALGPAAGESLLGRRVGAYELKKVIASGGMGTVYLAERADGQYRKTVAVKLIRRGMTDDEALCRFRNERQFLALLDHPHIARLLDGGVTSEGVPFLVMEYVEGRPFIQYCNEERLPVRRRLRLFQDVCAALEYAHRNLIVHRDLKPSNILVTANGTPKLLDFGIAKLLHGEGNLPGTGRTTTTGQHPLTPEYASPEQIRGERVTTTSDVYSLGVLLYELLTGHPPYRLNTRRGEEIERTILQTAPAAPSSIIWQVEERPGTDGTATRKITPDSVSRVRDGTPRKLSRRLRGDLDNIVLKALRKEPHRRYVSVAQLSEDIGFFLRGLPVRARRDSFIYRAGKFIRYHAVGTVAATFVFISVVLATAGIAREAHLAALQRDRAIAARTQSNAVVTFLANMLTSARPAAEGGDVTVREVLDKASRQIERDLKIDPPVKASLYTTIGRSYAALGLYEEAEAPLQRALELRRTQHAPAYEEVTESVDHLGSLRFAEGRLDEAEAFHREALALAQTHLDPGDPLTIRVKVNLAEVLGERRDLAGAEVVLQEVLAARRITSTDDKFDVAETLDRLADLTVRRGNDEQATEYLREALAIHRTRLGDEHPLVMEDMAKLAAALDRLGREEEAQALYGQIEPYVRRAVKMHRRAMGDRHIMTLVMINHLGELLSAMDRLDEAETMFREIVNTSQSLIAEQETPSDRLLNNTASAQCNLGSVLLRMGRLDEAESLLRQALAHRERSLGPDHLEVSELLEPLAEIAERRGLNAQAADLIQRALRIQRKSLAESHPDIKSLRRKLERLSSAEE